METNRYIIRKYRPEDREAVRNIFADASFYGAPIEGDRELAADFTNYYTDREPESAFVAEMDGRVIGFLLGCLDTERKERICKNELARPHFYKALRRGYYFQFKTFINLIRQTWGRVQLFSLRDIMGGEVQKLLKKVKAITTEYPAHLHIFIGDPSLRGKGIGKALIENYFAYLREHGISGVHLGTTSHNKQAMPLYLRCGFEILLKIRYPYADHLVPDPPVYSFLLARKLN